MKNTNTPERFIYCLEGNWNKHPKSNQSIKPILDLLYTFSKVKYIYRKCSTKDEFIKGLQTFTQKRYSNYTVLYIAYHGRKNRIYFGNEYITLKEIANVLEGQIKRQDRSLWKLFNTQYNRKEHHRLYCSYWMFLYFWLSKRC